MANSKNKYSVKGEIRSSSPGKTGRRTKAFDGPWKPTIEEAVEAYAAKYFKHGFTTELVLRAFFAERMLDTGGNAKDVKGVCYQKADTTKSVTAMLAEHNVQVASEA